MIWISGLLAAFLHFVFFLIESVYFEKAAWPIFRMSADQSQVPAVRMFAFNMGFYNLFLSLGAVTGLWWLRQGNPGGCTLLAFCCLSMVGAGLVLLVSRRRLMGPLIQALPPALCLWSLCH